MSIAQFQQAMKSHILHGDSTTTLGKFSKPYSEQELKARLSIYRNNTFYSLIEALKDLYPSLVATIGQELLSHVARGYIEKHPPTQACLLTYGHDFPLFLTTSAPLQKYPYLVDLAQLDLLYCLSFHASDEPAVEHQTFAALDIDTLTKAQIKAHSSAHLISSPYAIFDIWQLAKNDGDEHVDPLQRQNILVIRHENTVNLLKIDRGIFIFLESLTQEHPLGEALEIAHNKDDQFDPSTAITFLIQSRFSGEIIGEPS